MSSNVTLGFESHLIKASGIIWISVMIYSGSSQRWKNMSSVNGLIWACCNDITKDDSAELALAAIQDLSFPAFGESLSRISYIIQFLCLILEGWNVWEKQRAVWLQLPQKNNSINPINDQSCLCSCFPEVMSPHFAAFSYFTGMQIEPRVNQYHWSSSFMQILNKTFSVWILTTKFSSNRSNSSYLVSDYF